MLNVIEQVEKKEQRTVFANFHSLNLLLAQYLLANQIHALSYHAGLQDSLRQTIHTRWLNDECQVDLIF